MALIKDLNGSLTNLAHDDYVFVSCYCKVATPVDRGKDSCRVKVDWWLSKTTADTGGKRPLFTSYHNTPGVTLYS
jgi:hypothetical protein